MIKKKFHQFVTLEKGPVNTAIIDLLKGNVFQIENTIIEKFMDLQYSEIPEFIKSLNDEELLIKVSEERWIPQISDIRMKENDTPYFSLEIEEGSNLQKIKEVFSSVYLYKINFYGKKTPSNIFPDIKIYKYNKKFSNCILKSLINGDFNKIDESYYRFNKEYNSCWGRKIAITRDGNIRPCIYSDIKIKNIMEVKHLEEILEKMKKYWYITKDKVDKCKDCELRYVCFDCREIAMRKTGNLFATNPNCKYDPYKGEWLK